MSIEIELDINDYNCIIDWFARAHGKNNSAAQQDAKTYNKILVMGDAYQKMVLFLRQHGKDV